MAYPKIDFLYLNEKDLLDLGVNDPIACTECMEDVLKTLDAGDYRMGGESDDQIILYSIGGMPVEDVAWGRVLYEKALKEGKGTKLNLWDEPYLY